MTINNINLKKRLGMTRLKEADGGDGNGGNNSTDNNTESEDNSDDDKESNQESEKTFTQSELDSIIEKRLARERAKLEKEYKTKINEGITSGLDEAKKLEKMTAQEKAEYEFNKRLADLEAREKEYNLRELKQTALGILNEKGFDIESAKSISTILDYTDADKCKASIDNIDKLITGLVEKGVNAKIKTNKTPAQKETTGGVFTYQDYLANPTPENYKKWQKSQK